MNQMSPTRKRYSLNAAFSVFSSVKTDTLPGWQETQSITVGDSIGLLDGYYYSDGRKNTEENSHLRNVSFPTTLPILSKCLLYQDQRSILQNGGNAVKK